MPKQPENNNSKGLIGTLVVHGLLVLVFILYGLSVPLPLPAEKGIVINFGNTDMGSGDDFTNPNENVAEDEVQEEQVTTPPPPTPVTPTEEVVEEIITSADEEAPAIKPEKKKPQPKEEKKPEKKAEEKPVEKPKEEPRKVDPRAIYKGKTGGDGTTQETGNQGVKEGDVNSQQYEGEPGGGNNGVSLNLEGRSFVNSPKISDKTQVAGKIVVQITVDKKGNIITARAGARGTTISQAELWKKCEDALRGVKLNALSAAPDIQAGTVTFSFILE